MWAIKVNNSTPLPSVKSQLQRLWQHTATHMHSVISEHLAVFHKIRTNRITLRVQHKIFFCKVIVTSIGPLTLDNKTCRQFAQNIL